MALQSSQRLPELLFYTKKSYRILQGYPYTYIIHQSREFSIQNPTQKTKSSSSTTTTTTYRGQRDLHFRKRNSTHRRQGDLLEIHLCVLQDLPKTFQAFQPQDLPKAFQTFQTFQSFMTFQPFQAILQVPVSPGNPSHSSIFQLECIFNSSIGFRRKLHQVPVEQYKLQTFYKHYILQRKGDVVISVKIRIS